MLSFVVLKFLLRIEFYLALVVRCISRSVSSPYLNFVLRVSGDCSGLLSLGRATPPWLGWVDLRNGGTSRDLGASHRLARAYENACLVRYEHWQPTIGENRDSARDTKWA